MKNVTTLLFSLFMISFMTLLACHPPLKQQAKKPEQALRQIRFFYPTFRDDMDSDSLIHAINRSLEYLNKLPPKKIFTYGPHKFSSVRIMESLEAFKDLVLKNPSPKELNKKIRKHFNVYRATGRVGNNQVLFTGYYEPIYDGNLESDETFKYPLYGKPNDLLKIDLSRFHPRFKGENIMARIERQNVVPYHSRNEIEEEKALKGRGLEIAWLRDPVDVAFLHIQGSGKLTLPDGKLISVGYQASNGHQYRSIGRYMLDKELLTREEMSMQSIRRYLSEHPEIINQVLSHNPSYVFFQRLEDGPFGNISVKLTPGRSIALDSKLFPKGSLAFISCKKPVLNKDGEITKWIDFSRFVLNQDTGGAIRGAGRADLFWGGGKDAGVAAGHMKHDGELYVLIKKLTQ